MNSQLEGLESGWVELATGLTQEDALAWKRSAEANMPDYEVMAEQPRASRAPTWTVKARKLRAK